MGHVDVVIPTRNRLELTAQSIASVQAQTWRDWDLWVVDDGSDDGSLEALQSLAKADSRVHVVSQLRSGPASARERGFRMGQAPWIALLDSDDLWLPTKLEKQIATSADADVVLCWHEWFRPDGTVRVTRQIQGHGRVPPTLSNNMSTPLMRRDVVMRIGGIKNPESIPNVLSCEHIEFYLRLLSAARVAVVPEVLVRCRDHQGSRESDENASREGAVAMDEVVAAYEPLLADWPEERDLLVSSAALRLIGAGLARRGYSRYIKGWQAASARSKVSMLGKHGPFLVRNLPRLAHGR